MHGGGVREKVTYCDGGHDDKPKKQHHNKGPVPC